MRSANAFSAIVLAASSVFSLHALGGCVGEDPVSSGTDEDASTNDTTGGDAAAETDFSFEPSVFDLDPGQTATLTIRGNANSSVTLAVTPVPMLDGGTPAPTITLGASSVSLSASGEATVQVQAPASASQHRFRIVGTLGSKTHEVTGRVTGKPGELDLSFGDRGGYFDVSPDGDCTAHSVLVQPDGKFVVAGTSRGYTTLWVARFTRDGELDPTFGPNKAGFVNLGGARGPEMERMPDGSIAIAALAYNDPKLYRVTPDGMADPAWGGEDGIDPQLGGGNFENGAIGKQGANILVGGDLPDNATAVIKRYLPNGTIDGSFGQNGSISFTVANLPGTPGSSPRVHAIAVEDGGTFWVVGQYSVSTGAPYERTFVRRFKPDGTSDNVQVDGTFQGAATTLALQDGKAVVGAFEYPGGDYSAYAFRVSNSLDTTFGANGRALIAGPPGGFPTSMVTDAQQRIYVANGAYTTYTFDAYRLTPTGTLDTTFGPAGAGLARIPSGRAYGVAIDGRQLIVVGVNDANDQRRARIARFWL